MKRVRPLIGRAFSFAMIGTVGFAVDMGVLLLAISSVGPYWAKVPSSFVAIVATWSLNRYVTFRDRRRDNIGQEFSLYLASQIVGALVASSVYVVLISASDFMFDHPALALAAGSITAMGLNFLSSLAYVFHRAS